MACRACLKVSLLCVLLAAYIPLWMWCDSDGGGGSSACILWFAGFNCAGTILAGPFLAPACVAGIGLSLLKGIHIGSGPIHVNVKWDG